MKRAGILRLETNGFAVIRECAVGVTFSVTLVASVDEGVGVVRFEEECVLTIRESTTARVYSADVRPSM